MDVILEHDAVWCAFDEAVTQPTEGAIAQLFAEVTRAHDLVQSLENDLESLIAAKFGLTPADGGAPSRYEGWEDEDLPTGEIPRVGHTLRNLVRRLDCLTTLAMWLREQL